MDFINFLKWFEGIFRNILCILVVFKSYEAFTKEISRVIVNNEAKYKTIQAEWSGFYESIPKG